MNVSWSEEWPEYETEESVAALKSVLIPPPALRRTQMRTGTGEVEIRSGSV